MIEERAFQKRVQRVEELIREIETEADPSTRAKAVELVQSLMDFHGAGLERMMDIIAEAGQPGDDIFDRFAGDGLVASLLLLYGLHPLNLETRVMNALDRVRPYLGSHGGDVELISVADGEVRLRLQGSCHGCPSSAVTMKLAIEEAICEAAPDVSSIEVEGVVQQSSPPGFVQLQKSSGEVAAPQPANGNGTWETVSGLESLAQAGLRTMEVRGRSILFCRLGEKFYAYDNNCPGCDHTLQNARFEAASIVCPTCGQRYEVERAGRGLDGTGIHLEPFPLLVEQGQARVALPH